MPRLSAFVISENVQSIPALGGMFAQQVTGPMIALRPQFIPSSLSFGITFGVSGVNPTQANKLQTRILSPDGKVLNDTGVIDLPIDPNDDPELPLEYRGFIMNMDLRNIAIETSGCYTIELYVNGDLIDTRKIPVYKRTATK